MSSADGRERDQDNGESPFVGVGWHGSVATMLFESLVHQLLEKGILTRNDALSIVQTVAHVTNGRAAEQGSAPRIDAELAMLRRVYESFEAVRDRSAVATGDQANVRHLRPPLHQDAPKFPDD